MNRVAFVWGDGGIKGGFVAAAADTIRSFLPEGDRQISAIFASSASVGNALYFLSYLEDHPGKEMWTSVLTDKKFISYDGLNSLYNDNPVYDIDYMVDYIFKQKFPLNIDKLKSSNVAMYFPVIDFKTNKVVYFTNRPNEVINIDGNTYENVNIFDYDVYDVIRAASAAPFVYDRPVELGNRLFIDAAALHPIEWRFPSMTEAQKIVIATKGAPRLKDYLNYILLTFYWSFAIFPFRKYKYRMVNYLDYALKPFRMRNLIALLKDLDLKHEAVFISPLVKIGSNFDNSPAQMAHNYDAGVSAAKSSEQKIRHLFR